MIRMMNGVTGTEMLIADNRLNEYLARGHKLAPMPGMNKPEKATPAEMAAVRKKRKK